MYVYVTVCAEGGRRWQAFERYMSERGLDTLDELYSAPTLSDTLYRHVALGAHLSDDLADGDRLDALMVRASAVSSLPAHAGGGRFSPPLHELEHCGMWGC